MRANRSLRPDAPRRRPAAVILVSLAVASLVGPAEARTSPRTFTLAAGGDVLVHSRVADIAARNAATPGEWDFWPMMQTIEPWVSAADFSICHLEGTLSRTNAYLSYYPRFVVPHQLADALKRTGWDACSVASNHALDAGADGVASTLDVLDASGIGHSGGARTPNERLPSLYEVNGVTIAHLSFSQHFNGLAPPPDRPWVVNEIDSDRILADARWARGQGADFVVVSLHWGIEYRTSPIAYQTDLAATLLGDPAIDLILGHHPHVVEPIGVVGDKYVAYSMGNHISNQQPRWGPEYYGTNEGQLLFIHVSEAADGRFVVASIEVIPTWVRFDDLQVVAAQDALRLGFDPAQVLTASIERTMERTLRLDAPGVGLSADPWPAVSCEGIRATMLGTPGADELTGSDGADVIVARSGDDIIAAGGGDDVVCAGSGDDIIDTGAGFDRVFGGPGSDVLRGAGPLNVLVGGTGSDACSGVSIVVACAHP